MNLHPQLGDDRPTEDEERELGTRHCPCGAALPASPSDGYDVAPEPIEWVTDPATGDVHDVGGREGSHVEMFECGACGRDTFVEEPL